MDKIKLTSRDAIIEASFQIFNKRPRASLAEIAEFAGVGRATLHRHFASRDDLMIALANIAMEELSTAVETASADATSHTEGLKLSLAAIIPLAERQWFLAQEPVELNPDIAAAYAADIQALHAEIDAAKAEGVFEQNMPTEWIAQVYENLIYAAWTMVRNGKATAGQAAEFAWNTLINGTGVKNERHNT